MPIYSSIYDGPPNNYGSTKTTKRYVVIHNTSNDAPAKNEASYAKRRTDSVSSHYYVDSKQIIQSLNTDFRAFHVGSKTGNSAGIAYEITGTNAKSRAWWLSNVAWPLLTAQVRKDCTAHGITPRTLIDRRDQGRQQDRDHHARPGPPGLGRDGPHGPGTQFPDGLPDRPGQRRTRGERRYGTERQAHAHCLDEGHWTSGTRQSAVASGGYAYSRDATTRPRRLSSSRRPCWRNWPARTPRRPVAIDKRAREASAEELGGRRVRRCSTSGALEWRDGPGALRPLVSELTGAQ